MRDSSDSPTPAPDPLIGRQIRDLRIEERIGQGGMGAVYKAEHVLLHEPRALKVMRTEVFGSVPNAIERFEREARIAVKLRHPNLVLLYDFFVQDDTYFLVMEYVVGKSLAAFMREHGALSVEGTCRIGIQCCAGLAHAHEMGIIHRDLSPENVMLASSEAGLSVKIIDFGVARAAFAPSGQSIKADRTLTGVNEFIGKPRYASPEQAGALRRGETLDHRSDLYTLGLILFEMATGRAPFEADSPFDYLSQHARVPPPAPREVAPDLEIPEALERVILRCLEKDREKRYATARELSAALEWAWRSADTDLTRVSFQRQRALVPRPRRRVAPIAAGAAVAALAAGAGALFWFGRAVPRSEPVPEPEPVTVREIPAPAPAPAPVEPAAAPPEGVAAVDPLASAPAEPKVEPKIEPQPRPEPEVEPKPEPKVAVAVKREPKPKPAAARPTAKPTHAAEAHSADAKPKRVAFADPAEMQRAYDAALEFERKHTPSEAIANWKEFRGRAPSRDLDEKAKSRITQLTLGALPGL